MSLSGLIAGGYPEGSFDYSDSLTVTDPLPGLLSRSDLDRRFLVRGSPLSAGSPVAVDLTGGSASERGYGSLPTDAEHIQFSPGLAAAYNMSAALPPPDYSGWASGAIGAAGGGVRIANAGGAHDAIASHGWLGRPLDTYLGPGAPRTSLSLYTKIATATAAGATWDLDNINILYRDRRLLLQRALNETEYRGMGACLRGDGVNDEATGTVTCPAGSMTMECWARPLALSGGTTRAVVNFRNGSAAGERRISLLSSDVWRCDVRNDAGTAFAAQGVTPTLGTWYHLALVLDVAALKLRLYVGGALAQESTVSGTFATTTSAFALLRLADSASNWFSGEVDEVRLYSIAKTQAQIQTDMNREVPATATGLAQCWQLNEGSGATAGNLIGGNPSLTITGATWVGSLEGDATLAGKPKPRAYGQKRQIEPVLVDPQRNVYQVNDGSVLAIDAVRDSGDPLSFGSDASDIFASTPAAGTYNTCLAKGLLRLNAAPLGTLTADVRGDNSGALGYVSSAANICRKMAGLVFTDPDGFDTAYFAALNTLTAAVCGYYSGTDEVAIDAAMETVIRSVGGWLAIERLGTLRCGRVDPPEDLTATIALGQSDLRDPSKGGVYRRDLARVPVKRVRVGYRRYNRVLSETEVAGAVSATVRSDYGQEFRFATSRVSAVAPEDGDILTVLTELDASADAQAEADRLLSLWESERSVYTLAPKVGVLTYFFGDVVTLTHPRYETSAGKKGVVVGFVENFGEYRSPDEISVQILLEAA